MYMYHPDVTVHPETVIKVCGRIAGRVKRDEKTGLWHYYPKGQGVKGRGKGFQTQQAAVDSARAA